MKYTNQLLTLFCTTLMIFFVSCNTEEALSEKSVVELGKTERKYTELDRWIYDNITQPYGIKIQYRWHSNQSTKGDYVYPPKVEKVKEVLETIKPLWFEIYENEYTGGKGFLKGNVPITIYMYGGRNIDVNGVELIANVAAIGKEMFIYNVNDFDVKNADKVYVLMRSVHHQYARLLGENFRYNRDNFAKISDKTYISSTRDLPISNIPKDGVGMYALKYYPKKRDLWKCGDGIPFEYFMTYEACDQAHKDAGIDKGCYFVEYTQNGSNEAGFFTYHSMLSPEADFAEVVSVYITNKSTQLKNAQRIAGIPRYGETAEEKARNKAKADKAQQTLIEKEMFVEDFFKKNVGFSIKRLQLLSQQRTNQFLNRD